LTAIVLLDSPSTLQLYNMRCTALVSFVLLALGMNTQAITVEWYKDRNNCNGTPSETYRVDCNTCVDPPFGTFNLNFPGKCDLGC
jgi:hypothetical protein